MLSSGFTNAPTSQALVILIVVLPILSSLSDTKAFLPLALRPHLLTYAQYWRLLTYPLAYSNSTEVLFAATTAYNLRVIERLWGTRKFLSFLLATAPYTVLAPPLLLIVLSLLTWGRINYLPSGPTAVVFALMAQYHATIPYAYKYALSTPSPGQGQGSATSSVVLTSKATAYLLPLQLALSQLPGSAIVAATGWVVGYAYRLDLLPGAAGWRVPDRKSRREERARYEGLRRRMEGEVGSGSGSEVRGTEQGGEERRRGVAGQILDQFRGVF